MTDIAERTTRSRRAPTENHGADSDFGRQPPQDLAAEQSVLGGMLLSKDAIADVLEQLRPSDFYRPAHETIFTAILDLYARGEPADAVTVAAELERRGLSRRIGGPTYLHTLIATVPTAANAGYYATIVAEKALLRRLVEAGTRVVQYGYAGADGADLGQGDRSVRGQRRHDLAGEAHELSVEQLVDLLARVQEAQDQRRRPHQGGACEQEHEQPALHAQAAS